MTTKVILKRRTLIDFRSCSGAKTLVPSEINDKSTILHIVHITRWPSELFSSLRTNGDIIKSHPLRWPLKMSSRSSIGNSQRQWQYDFINCEKACSKHLFIVYGSGPFHCHRSRHRFAYARANTESYYDQFFKSVNNFVRVCMCVPSRNENDGESRYWMKVDIRSEWQSVLRERINSMCPLNRFDSVCCGETNARIQRNEKSLCCARVRPNKSPKMNTNTLTHTRTHRPTIHREILN